MNDGPEAVNEKAACRPFLVFVNDDRHRIEARARGCDDKTAGIKREAVNSLMGRRRMQLTA